MNRHEHPTDAAVTRLPLASDEQARLRSDPAAKQALFQEIVRMPLEAPSTLPTARRAGVLAAAVGTLSVAAVAGAVALFSSDTTSVGCHLPEHGLTVVDAVTGDPIADCAALWERSTGQQAPTLVAYDNGSGGIEVLPADQRAPDGWSATGPGVVQDPVLLELEAALGDVADGLPADCRLLGEAEQIATAELARLGLDGWTVTSERGEADGSATCTFFLLDAEARQVVLIPLEGGAIPADAPPARFARDLADALDADCVTVGEAGELARNLAAEAGIDPVGLMVHELADAGASCTRVDVNVGGRVEVTLRGPSA